MSLERYFSVKIRKWRIVYFKPKTAILISISMGVILFIINMTFVSLINYDTKATNITCYIDDNFTKDMEVF